MLSIWSEKSTCYTAYAKCASAALKCAFSRHPAFNFSLLDILIFALISSIIDEIFNVDIRFDRLRLLYILMGTIHDISLRISYNPLSKYFWRALALNAMLSICVFTWH